MKQESPSRVKEFEGKFFPLKTDLNFSAELLPNVLAKSTLQNIRQVIRGIKKEHFELHEAGEFGRLVVHNHEALTQIQKSLESLVSECVRETIESSYNFLSLYTSQGKCALHLDSPMAKYTLDLCINQNEDWPIFISNTRKWEEIISLADRPDWEKVVHKNVPFESYSMRPGDGILFSGSSQWHFRNPITPTSKEFQCDLLFFHYIPKGTLGLVKPSNWANMLECQGINFTPQL